MSTRPIALLVLLGLASASTAQAAPLDPDWYKFGIYGGCMDQGAWKGVARDASEAQCACAVRILEREVSDADWQAAAASAARNDGKDAQILAPQFAKLAECRQPDQPAAPAPARFAPAALDGRWVWKSDLESCTTTLTFRSDGSGEASNGSKDLRFRYAFDEMPTPAGRYRVTIKMDEYAAAGACGAIPRSEVGNAVDLYVLPYPVRPILALCAKDSGQSCKGPFRKSANSPAESK